MKADPTSGAAWGRHEAYRTPGLYLDWDPKGLAGRRRLASGVPVFAGFVKAGSFGPGERHARQFDRWERFDAAYRAAAPGDLLSCAVRGFFENGGERCIVQPVQTSLDAWSDVHDRAEARELADRLISPFSESGVLRDLEYVDLVCVPDAMTPQLLAFPEYVFDVQREIVEYCARLRDRFAILDTMPALAVPKDDSPNPANRAMLDAITQWQSLPAEHGALYFPWVRVRSPRPNADARETVLVPPCGHIAGVYARSDRRVGVHKAPANELLEGVLDVDVQVNDRDQADLNDAGVNCLREWPGRGLRVWGARTLSDRATSRYVNVTRLVLAVTRELERNLRDLVFEPHNAALWGAVEDRVRGYLRELHSSGALKGRDPSEAYFVKCNAETNSVEGRDAGTLVAQIGLAATAPAEFVIVRITQSADGVTLGGPATQA
jgi:hypothetical protein